MLRKKLISRNFCSKLWGDREKNSVISTQWQSYYFLKEIFRGINSVTTPVVFFNPQDFLARVIEITFLFHHFLKMLGEYLEKWWKISCRDAYRTGPSAAVSARPHAVPAHPPPCWPAHTPCWPTWLIRPQYWTFLAQNSINGISSYKMAVPLIALPITDFKIAILVCNFVGAIPILKMALPFPK